MPLDLIDVHAHCVPEPVYARMQAGGLHFGVRVVDGGHDAPGPRWEFDSGARTAPIEPLLIDIYARLARMDEARVSVQLLSGFIDTGAHQVAGNAAGYAAWFNDALAAVIAEHPTRFAGLGTLPLPDADASVAELRRIVEQLGFVGVEVPARSVLDPGMEPVWADAARLGAVVLVHPEASTTSDLPYFLGNFVSNPAETTAAAGALILSGVFERVPELAVVLVHGGGFLPFQFARMAHGFSRYGSGFGATATVNPRDQLRHLHYDTVLHDPAAIAYLISVVGADRVVTGTDDPFAMGDAQPSATVDSIAGLERAERDGIRHGNIGRVLARVANGTWAALLEAHPQLSPDEDGTPEL